MRRTERIVLLGLGVGLLACLGSVPAFAQELSHARIVRLSFGEGTVTVQRPDVTDWAEAPVNTPIQEGFKLSTAASSFAEVEFENTSTARLGEFSLLEFTQLALSPSGGKLNRLTLHNGYATFSVIPEEGDVHEVKAAEATLTPQGKTTFRVDFDEALLRVEVFKGAVEVFSPQGSGTIGKNSVLDLRPGEADAFTISQGITKDAWDEWVEQREEEVAMARNRRAPSLYANDVPSLLYGWHDLFNYGSWSYFAGFGYGWAPHVPYGWAPYTSGRWCWYPGLGYTWISYEPWGWLPYHYGQWGFQLGSGWFWIPDTFASWSPALVTWYQGPGWVGWAPRTPAGTLGPPGCPHAPGCFTTVSAETFQNGGAVTPSGLLGVDITHGQPVPTPGIVPGPLGRLPGPVIPGGVAVHVRRYAEQSVGTAGRGRVSGEASNVFVRGTPAGGTPSVAPDQAAGGAPGAPTGPGIVFDPVDRRYVNAPGPGAGPSGNLAPGSAPTAGSRGPAGTNLGPGRPLAGSARARETNAPRTTPPAVSGVGDAQGSPGVWVRPGPRADHPVALPSGSGRGPRVFGERGAAPSVPPRFESPGAGAAAPRSGPSSSSVGERTPASRPTYSPPPTVRSAPAANPRFEGGSVPRSAIGSGSSGSVGVSRSSGAGPSGAIGGGMSGAGVHTGGGGGHTSGRGGSRPPR